jgi:hypothetical protein
VVTPPGAPAGVTRAAGTGNDARNPQVEVRSWSDYDSLEGKIYFIVMSFLGWFAGWAAGFLDYVIKDFVIGFGSSVDSSGVGSAIDTLWALVRDLFNILFIFAIIYIGFKMILRRDEGGAQKALAYLVMAALLINFSLFISKAIVDFTNLLATEIGQAGFPNAGAAQATITPDREGEILVGQTFFNNMRLTTSLAADGNLTRGGVLPWGYIFGNAIVYVIAIFAFMAGAIMLLIRYAALCVFMVFSPLMFIGWILPNFRGTMEKYWRNFLGRAFFAPAYMIMIYLSSAVIVATVGQNSLTIGDAMPGATTNTTGLANTAGDIAAGIGPFALSAVFLIMSVMVAGYLSADGSKLAMRTGQRLARGGRRMASNAAMRTGKFAARNTAGYGAQALGAEAEQGRKNFQRRMALQAQKGGWRAKVARGMDKTFTPAYKKMESASVAGSETIEQKRKRVAEQDKNFATIARKTTGNSDIEAAKDISLVQENMSADDRQKLDAAEKAANRISLKELEEMSNDDRLKVLRYLKAPTVSKLLESDNVNEADKKALGKEYEDIIKSSVLDENGRVINDEFAKLTKQQIEILGDEFAKDFAHGFTDSQVEDFKKSDAFTQRQKDTFQKARGDEQKRRAAQAPTRKAMFTGTETKWINGARRATPKSKARKAVDIASLPYEAFVDTNTNTIHSNSIPYLTADVLKALAKKANDGKSDINEQQRRELARKLLSLGVAGGVSLSTITYLGSNKGKEDFYL